MRVYKESIMKKIVFFALIGVICLLPLKCFAADTYVGLDARYDRYRVVKTTKDVFYDKQLEFENYWTAKRIPQGTILGTVYITDATYRSLYTQSASYGYNSAIRNAYKIWLDVYVTMVPSGSVVIKLYYADNYAMDNCQMDPSGVTDVLYGASECVTTSVAALPTPSGKDGFIFEFYPNNANSTEGEDTISFDVGCSISKSEIGVSLGTSVTMSHEFVSGTVYTDVSKGIYKNEYDYLKTWNGWCSSQRQKIVFSNTTIHGYVAWYQSANLKRAVIPRADATFTFCNGSKWFPKDVYSQNEMVSGMINCY